MTSTKRIVSMIVLMATTTMAACDQSSTAPEGPSVAGTWTGEFGGSSVRMVLSQSGDAVTGTLDVGVRSYRVDGTVSMAGTFAWVTDVAQSDCSGFSSSAMQLEAAGAELNGVARRASTAPPCGSGGRVRVQQGTMALTRAF